MKDTVISISNKEQSHKEKANKIWLLGAFLVWPFLAFVLAIKNFKLNFSKKIILGFFLVYGFTFVVNEQMDGQRYAMSLQTAANTEVDDILKLLSNPYDQRKSVDMLEPILTFLVSRFTTEHHLLFSIFAFIFGYFYLKSISGIYKHYEISHTKNALIFMMMLPWLIPIFQINGFRMWTAAWIFFFGTYQLVYYNKKWFLWLALSASLVHFSFLSASAILILYLLLKTFIGNRTTLFMGLAIVTFFLSELPMEAIRNFVMSLGGGIQERIGYLDESYIEQTSERGDQAAWFIKLASSSLHSLLMVHVIMAYIYIKKHAVDKNFKSLFSFSLLFISYSNIISLLPSGGRFKSVLYILLIAMLVIYYSSIYVRPKMRKLTLLIIPTLLLNALIAFRVGAATLNTIIFFPSLIIIFFYDLNWPVLDWLFELFTIGTI